MIDKKIRPLRADEIEVRVASITGKGYQLILYKNSRCDKRILDEVFGPMYWKSETEWFQNRASGGYIIYFCNVTFDTVNMFEFIVVIAAAQESSLKIC